MNSPTQQHTSRTWSLLLSCLAILFFLFPDTALCQAPETEEGYVTSEDGTRLFYKILGNGPETLIVLHGGPGNSMDSLIPDLAPLAQGRRVIYYDQRGNGRSDLTRKKDQLGIAKHIADLEAIRRHFNLERMNLLGNSWGGLLAGFYAIAHPERVARMILHSPASPSFALLRDSTGYIYQRIPRADRQRFISVSYPDLWVNAKDPLQLCRMFYDIIKPVYFTDITKADLMKGDTCGAPLAAVRLQLLVNKLTWESLGDWDLQPELIKVPAPTLVIHGSDDMIPSESSEAWAAAMPDARLLIIQECGHMTHIEQPEVFFSAVKTFLAGDWPATAQRIEKRYDKIRIAPPRDHLGREQPFLSPPGP